MRAVNLIPVEDRRGAGAPGRSGGAVYALLGGLAVVVVMVAALFATAHSVEAKNEELATVTQQTRAAEAQAGSLQAYTQFATLRTTRQQTVASLAATRFDWAHALHELARTVPRGTALSSLRATVSPSVSVPGTADPLRPALTAPAIELVGCARSQGGVAEFMAAMRRMDQVQRVSLSSSERNAKGAPGAVPAAGAAGGTGGGASDCRGASSARAQFSVIVFYTAPAAAAAPTTTGPATAASTTPAPATGGTK